MDIHASPDGTGHVEVSVALDKDAAVRAAGLRPRTDDLTGAGWEVESPERTAAGGVIYRVQKRFRSPDEAARLIREVAGARGPLRGFRLIRERSFLETRTRLTGTVDLRAGAAAFGDPALTELLGGQPLGVEPARVAALDDALQLQVTGELPGRTARVTARPGQRVPVAFAAERWNLASIAFAFVALLALAAFAVSVRRALRARQP